MTMSEESDTAAEATTQEDDAAQADAPADAPEAAPEPETEPEAATTPQSEPTPASEPAPTDEAAPGVEDPPVVDVEELLEPVVVQKSPYDKPGRWYVVHTQSGYEKKVKQNLEARISSMNMEGRIYETVIPMDDVVEFKGGKKVVVQKKMFPGYLLVRCELDDDSWYVVRNTPGIVNFVGAGGKPSPLSRREVETFLHVPIEGATDDAKSKIKPRLAFAMGETVRVKEGPFADFSGEVVEINEDQAKVKVLVNIFGRETPVELEFAQVARL